MPSFAKRSVRTLVLVLVLASHNAHAGGAVAGALEITQLANYAELIHQSAESARQTITQIAQLQSMLQNLKSLDPRSLAEIGLNALNLPELRKLYPQVQDLVDALDNGRRSAGRLEQSALDVERLSKIAIALLQAPVKKPGGGTVDWRDPGYVTSVAYEQRIRDAEQRVLELRRIGIEARTQEVLDVEQYRQHMTRATQRFDADYQQTLSMAQRIPGITGQVQGLQFLAAQNVHLNRSMTQVAQLLGTQAAEQARQQVAKARMEDMEKTQARSYMNIEKSKMQRTLEQVILSPTRPIY